MNAQYAPSYGRADPSAVSPRVLVASIARASGETGGQTHAETFLRYLTANGWDAQRVTPHDLRKYSLLSELGVGAALHALNKRLWLTSYYKISRLLLKQCLRGALTPSRRSIVYAQDPVSAVAALSLKSEGFPMEVVLAVHFNRSQADEWVDKGFLDARSKAVRSIRLTEEFVLKQVDRLVFPSMFMKQDAFERCDIDPERAYVVPNFIEEPGSELLPFGSGDLITIGTLEPRKNHEFLLDVIAEAHRRGARLHLTIIGDGPLRSELVRQIRRKGLDEFVHFAGYVPNAARFLAGHRAYVHSARLENLPVALIEALAAGLPVFAAPVGGIPEVFSDDVEGVMWNPDDPAGAAARLVCILDDEKRYRRMAVAARARYETTFAPEVVGPRLLQAVIGCSTKE